MRLEAITTTVPGSQAAAENAAHLERYVNSPKGEWTKHSDVPKEYSPEADRPYFDVPYVDVAQVDAEIHQASPDPPLAEHFLSQPAIPFFIHPAVVPPDLEISGTRRGVPTASTRTLAFRESDLCFMVKTDLDRRHFRFHRRLRGNSVRHSVAMSAELMSIAGHGTLARYAILPESIGVVAQLNGRETGMIVRECSPFPVAEDDRSTVPYFSLYSPDQQSPADLPLLVQILEAGSEADKLAYFVEDVIGPIQDAWTALVAERGILPELHGQNALLELDRNGRPQRLVHRDFQSLYTDPDIRAQGGLPPYSKHIAGTEDGISKPEQYSLVFDHIVSSYLIKRLTDCFLTYYSNFDLHTVAGAIRERFAALPQHPEARFPDTVHRFGGETTSDNSVRVIDTGIAPVFR